MMGVEFHWHVGKRVAEGPGYGIWHRPCPHVQIDAWSF